MTKPQSHSGKKLERNHQGKSWWRNYKPCTNQAQAGFLGFLGSQYFFGHTISSSLLTPWIATRFQRLLLQIPTCWIFWGGFSSIFKHTSGNHETSSTPKSWNFFFSWATSTKTSPKQKKLERSHNALHDFVLAAFQVSWSAAWRTPSLSPRPRFRWRGNDIAEHWN